MKNKINCPCSTKKGFTLLEITVVVAIITLLSTIFLANYRAGERVFALQRSIHKLSQDLRRVEEMAISARKFEDTFPKGGYGIYFEKNSTPYILFADCDGNNQYDSSGTAFSCEDADFSLGEFYPFEKIEESFLETGIKISEFSPLGDSLTITFFPPDPEVTFNADPSINQASITLTIDGQEKKVYIYRTGLIDVD